ncbi:BA14K family protein [Rhodobium gokarnense]|uniref:Lectin-like protein BA14k n=1 Tax=Rhodobium gokarnense TaxID=364296 RepID=A0ABT3HDS0_9HYPH|nr:BA14K family protein [Rhodobium gokarnense]MCW2308525.1 hypothetical protein [Rhodobium gokarnense]
MDMTARHRYSGFLAVAAVWCLAAPAAYAQSAWETIEQRPPRLGSYVTPSKKTPGLLYLAPPGVTAPDRSGLAAPAPVPPTPPSAPQVSQAPAGGTAPADGGLQPWSDAWARDCARRYPSFDRNTGTYRSPAGHYEFCQ